MIEFGKYSVLFILGAVLIGGIFVSADIINQSPNEKLNSSFSYTPSTETNCNGNTCNKVLYSGTRFVNEDNTWKPIENARSLKNSSIKCVVVSDGEHIAKCLDYNMTSVTLDLNTNTKTGIVPIKVYEKNETTDKNGNSITENILKDTLNYNFLSAKSDVKSVVVQANYGDVIHFGDNSTTIILQDADTENLADIGTYRTGTSGGNYYVKFNLTQIPSLATIDDVTLATYVTSTDSGDGIMTFYKINNQTWTEDGSGVSYFSSMSTSNTTTIDCGSPTASAWCNFNHANLSSMVQESLEAGDDSITLKLYADTESNVLASDTTTACLKYQGPSSNHWCITTKEYGTAALRPYLNITYTESGGDTTPPTISTIPDNASIFYGNQTLNVTFVGTDETGFSGYSINDTSNFQMGFSSGFLINNTDLAVGNYAVNVTINDTSNNINWTIFTVEVNKSIPFGSVSGTSPITYGTAGDVQGSETNPGDSDLSYELYRDGINVSNPDTSTLGAGSYNYIYNTSGGTNYSSNASLGTFSLTVDQSSDNCQVLFNETSPITYPSQFQVYSDCTSTFTLYKNGTVISNDSVQDSGSGTWNFSVQRTDTSNYSNTYDDEYFTVDQATPSLSLSVTNSTYPSNGIMNASETNSGDGDLTYELYIDGDLDDTGSDIGVVKDLSAGTYVIVYNTSGGTNYTSSSTQLELKISQGTPSLSTSVTSPLTYGTASDYSGSESNSGDSDLTYELYRNGTLIDTGSSVSDTSTLGVSYYEYIYNTTGGTNYSSGSDTKYLTINQAVPSGTLTNNSLLNLTYGNPFNFSYSETNSGDSDLTYEVYRNGTNVTNEASANITLGAGFYSYVLNSSGGTNYTLNASMDTFDLTINKGTLSGTINSTQGFTIEVGTATNITYEESNTGDSDVNYTLWNGTLYFANNTQFDEPIGTYTIILNSTGGANYSSNSNISTQVLTYQSTSPPSFSQLSPADNTEDTDGILDFSYNVSSTNSISWCSLYIDNSSVKNDSSITVNSLQTFQIKSSLGEYAPEDSLYWYVSCQDSSGNLGNSTIRYIDTLEGGGSGGGGGSGDPVSVVLPTSEFLCTETYDYVLKYGSTETYLTELVNEISSKVGSTQDYSTIGGYVFNWQSLCSDLIHRTLHPDIICKKISEYGKNNSNEFYESDIEVLSRDLSTIVPISGNLIEYYILNNQEVCKDEGYDSIEAVLNVPGKEYDLDNCSLNTGIDIFDAGIPFFKINVGEQSSCSLSFWKYLVGFEEKGSEVVIDKIKIIVILLIVLVFSIKFLKRKNTKRRTSS